jgi:hypothetical protein
LQYPPRANVHFISAKGNAGLLISGVKLDLAKVVKEGCKEEGLVGLIFNTIGVRCAAVLLPDTSGC